MLVIEANSNPTQIGMRDGVTGEFKLVPKAEAVVSVFDSNFLIGDGIWVRA
jgi:branched-chain amino acid aminotransferase